MKVFIIAVFAGFCLFGCCDDAGRNPHPDSGFNGGFKYDFGGGFPYPGYKWDMGYGNPYADYGIYPQQDAGVVPSADAGGGSCPEPKCVTGECGPTKCCIEGQYCSTEIINCAQTTCPEGAGRTDLLSCNCGQAWGDFSKIEVRDPCSGLVVKCIDNPNN